jgi:hypothetical protein
MEKFLIADVKIDSRGSRREKVNTIVSVTVSKRTATLSGVDLVFGQPEIVGHFVASEVGTT